MITLFGAKSLLGPLGPLRLSERRVCILRVHIRHVHSRHVIAACRKTGWRRTHLVRLSNLKDETHANCEMPFKMTMKHPEPGIISFETESCEAFRWNWNCIFDRKLLIFAKTCFYFLPLDHVLCSPYGHTLESKILTNSCDEQFMTVKMKRMINETDARDLIDNDQLHDGVEWNLNSMYAVTNFARTTVSWSTFISAEIKLR